MIKAITEMLNTTRQSYYNWKKTKPIISFLENYFTKEELEEYLSTNKIQKLELIKKYSLGELHKKLLLETIDEPTSQAYSVSYYLDKLFEHYHVNSIIDLADKMDISQPSISKWKTRNSINAIKKRCRELDIYNQIFNTLEQSNMYPSIYNNTITKTLLQELQDSDIDENELQIELLKLVQRLKAKKDEDNG